MGEEKATRLLRRDIRTYDGVKFSPYYACGLNHVPADPQHLLFIFFETIIGVSP